MKRAWSLLTIEGARQYGGNTGYDDDPESVYRYDSDVANHLRVQVGDICFIRTRAEVLGFAEIESILENKGQKDRLRCPQCNATNIKRRLTKLPPWGCKNGHFFDEPVNEPVTVTTYEARYAASYRPAPPDLTVAHLHEAVLRPSDQMSIKELDLALLEPVLGEDTHTIALLRRFTSAMPVPQETAADQGTHQSIIEQRRRVLREISLRRGQPQFRERLIKRYGVRCQISGYTFAAAVEAAHIQPYARCEDNSAGNGLLLRSDLHTLFDLGLIGIDPLTLQIAFNPDCLCDSYAPYDGAILFVGNTGGPDQNALTQHWEFFRSCLSKK